MLREGLGQKMGGLGQGLAGAWTGAWTKNGGAWTVLGLGLAWGIHHNGVGDAPSYEHSLTVGSAFFCGQLRNKKIHWLFEIPIHWLHTLGLYTSLSSFAQAAALLCNNISTSIPQVLADSL